MKKNFKFYRCRSISALAFFGFLIVAILLVPKKNIRAQVLSPDTTIELKAIPGLRYDKARFTVKPGSTVEIILLNTDEMMHNLLVVKPGTRKRIVQQAGQMGEEGLENDFTPQSSDILAAIPMLAPDERASVIFQVLEKEGVYPYVCTYPAHGVVMYGAMYVTNNPDNLPPLEEDPHIPEMHRSSSAISESLHPYPMDMPQITRLFMPQASPAAIAVGMEYNQSYCWDAGYCFLRYAWRGGYINASKQWDAKSTEFAGIVGEIFFRNEVGFPFRIVRSDSIPEPDFQGYKLVNGYPEFRYAMGGTTVYEYITPLKEDTGLKISYRMENIHQPLWYVRGDGRKVRIEASKGRWKGNKLKLSPDEAAAFTISISPKQTINVQ